MFLKTAAFSHFEMAKNKGHGVPVKTEKQRQAAPVLLEGLSERRQGGCGLFKAANF